jgi:hypothetical protein
MKIKELQERIAAVLNANEELVQGGCKAIAEESLTVLHQVQTQIQLSKGVAIVVSVPSIRFAGISPDGCISVDAVLSIKCMEIRALTEKAPQRLTALSAAELVAITLTDSETTFNDISLFSDGQSGILSATVSFETTTTLN